MVITLLFIVTFFVGMVLFFVGFVLDKTVNKRWEKKDKKAHLEEFTEKEREIWENKRAKSRDRGAVLGGAGCVIMVFGAIISLILGLVIGLIKNDEDLFYEQMQAKYEALQSAVETDSENYVVFFDDITEYNNTVIAEKWKSKDVWRNWFHNEKVGELPLITGELRGK